MSFTSQIRTRAFAVFAIGGGVLTTSYLLAVLSPLGQQIEDQILKYSDYNTAPPAPLGLVSPWFVAIILIIMSALAWWQYGAKRTIVLWFTSALAILASQFLKHILDRPDLSSGADLIENSFPSGHMTVFTTLVVVLLLSVPQKAQPVAIFTGVALLCVVAWQLLMFGWHRPSDIVGALALVAVIFMVPLIMMPNLMMSTRGDVKTRRFSIHANISGALVAISIITLIAGAATLAVVTVTNDSAWLALVGAALISCSYVLITVRMLIPFLPRTITH